MKLYSIHWGSWRDKDGVQTHYFIPNSYNPYTTSRKEAFETAQRIANEIQQEVTIRKKRGMYLDFFTVKPI